MRRGISSNTRWSLVLLGLLLVLSLTGSGTLYAADKPMMSFSSLRNNTAQKDWSTDSCTGSMTATKQLTIVGSFPTGRTDDLKDQKMVIVINNFHGTDTYSSGLNQSYFEDIFSAQKKKTTYKSGIVVITGYDLNTGMLSGTFSFALESNPPNLDPFKTSLSKGQFSAAFENELQVQVAPGKDPFTTNANTKVNYKVKVTDVFGNLVEGAEISCTDEINKKKGEKIGTSNSSGELIYQLEIAEATKSADYELSFSATKAKYKSSQTVKKTISVSGRYWVYKCAGLPLLTFDAGAGNEWKKLDDTSPILSHSGKAMVNDVLELNGSIKIDPTAGQEAVTGEYSMSIPSLKIGGSSETLELIAGKALHYALLCDTKYKLQTPEVLKRKIGGVEFTLEELSFQDVGFGSALSLKCKGQWESVKQNACEGNSNSPDKGEVEFGVSIVKEELGGYSLGSISVSFTDCVLPAFPQFCMTELACSYDNIADQFKISAGCAFKVGANGPKKAWDGSIKGSLTLQKGKFEAFSFEGSTSPGLPVPGVEVFMWTGLKLGTSGWAEDQWKAQSAEITGVFTSVDDQLLKRLPVLSTYLAGNNICEIEIGAKLTYPFIIEGGLKLSLLKLPQVSVTKPWQVEASLKGSMDFVKGIRSKSKYVKAFHFGADDYVINIGAESDQSVVWEDQFSFSCKAEAKFRIPDIPGESPNEETAWLLKSMKSMGVLPHDLGMAGAYLRCNKSDGLVATGVVDLQQNPVAFFRSLGRISMEVGVHAGAYLKFSGFDKNIMFIRHAGESNDIQSVGADSRRSIAATSLDSFRIDAGLERAFVMVRSAKKIPATTLVSPSGQRITATTSDSSVILFKSSDTKLGFWSLINPAQGIWVVETVNPAKTDSVFILGLSKMKDKPFVINASASGRVLNVTWDRSLYTTGDRIDLFLNDRNSGAAGIPIGTADATLGSFSYTMTDSLPFCSCYVYGLRVVDGLSNEQAYVNTEFNTGRNFAAAPANIVVQSNHRGQSTLQWVPVTDPSIRQYGIMVRTPDGFDSLLTTVHPSLSSAYVECDTTLLRSLFMVSYDSLGRRGCPRKAESITVGVEQPGDELLSTASSIAVSPQPAHERLSFMPPADFNTGFHCELYDNVGNRVLYRTIDAATPGQVSLDVSQLSSGCYILRISDAHEHRAVVVTVLH